MEESVIRVEETGHFDASHAVLLCSVIRAGPGDGWMNLIQI